MKSFYENVAFTTHFPMNDQRFSRSQQGQGNDMSAESALDWPRRVGAIDETLTELNLLSLRRRRRYRISVFALTTSIVLAAGVFWQWRSVVSYPAVKPEMSIVVVPVEHRKLSDGSIISLKDGAEIEVAFTSETRAVTLLKGTVSFQVTKNPQRPFVVTARNVTVRAVGTVFCVGLEPKSVEVIVTEGRVSVNKISHETQSSTYPQKLTDFTFVDSGEHVLVRANSDIIQSPEVTATTLSPDDLVKKLTWLSPRLEFTGTPLEMVVLAFNQHNRRQLVLADPELRNLQISGVLHSSNIPALLRILKSDFNIQAEDRGNEVIILSRAHSNT